MIRLNNYQMRLVMSALETLDNPIAEELYNYLSNLGFTSTDENALGIKGETEEYA